ncbi:unnamed protein product, partial [Adineta steineri]
ASFVSGIIYNCNRTADCGCSRSNANVYKIVGGEDSYPLSWGWAVSLQLNCYDNITNVHDIAVLLLNESLPISNEMNTARICLPRLETSDRNVTYPVNSASLVSIGWGLLKSDAPEIASDQHLQQVTVASVSVDDPRC